MFLMLANSFLVACSNDDDSTPSQASILQKAEGIIELKSGIGNWDAAYLTKKGYFCYKKMSMVVIANTAQSIICQQMVLTL